MAIEILVGKINEGSTAFLTISFYNKLGVLAVPTSATYRIDDVATSTAIKATTPLVGGSSVELTISPTENRILSQANEYETREVTIIADFGAGEQMTSSMRYRVTNLLFKA